MGASVSPPSWRAFESGSGGGGAMTGAYHVDTGVPPIAPGVKLYI